MSLELIREVIKANQIIGENTTQIIVEHDIIVPDVNPDVSEILLMDGDIYVSSVDVLEKEVLISGDIKYKILYVSDDVEGPVKSINLDSSFSNSLDMPDSQQGMRAKVKCDIEHMEYEVLNGRKINAKSVLKIKGVLSDQVERSYINNLEGIEDVQILKKNYNINWFLGRSEVASEIKEIVEIPSAKQSIREILRTDVKIIGKDYNVTEDRVIVKGELNTSTLYLGEEDNRIQHMEHEIPFTQFVDLEGITDDSYCEVDYNITSTSFEATEDSDGELRALNCEVSLDIFVDGFEKRDVDIIEDAYSPFSRLEIDKDSFDIEELISENKSQIILKESIQIPFEKSDISEVFNVVCKPVLSEYTIDEGRVVIEGVVDNKILYISENTEEPILCYEQDFPIRHEIELDNIRSDMSCDIEIDVEHCSYSMISSKEVEVRLTIGVIVKAAGRVTLPLITEVDEMRLEDTRLESTPSITIYFTQPGDSLWKIAKKYQTTIENIQRINSEENLDAIIPGKQIIISKKANR